jgi:hypothetical protein
MIRANAMQAIAEIGRLQATMDRLAQVPRRAATIAAPGLTRLLQAEFREGKDPYGRAWAPLRPATLATGRRPPPLTGFTRALKRGTRAEQPRANYAGIRLVVGAPYGYFAQVGFRNARTGTRVPSRRILPQHGVPRAWSAVLDRAVSQAARQARAR